jgi:hypothetical protein
MFALQYDEFGNWLDAPVLIESVGTHEGPEYAEDVDAYRELVANLEGICHYRATLDRLGGINQHYSIEAYEYIPNWEEKVPKSYYSQHLSQVQYKLTQEGLLQTFWETIKRLWHQLVEWIKKGFYRLMGRTAAGEKGGVTALLAGPITEAEVKEAEERIKVQQYGIRKKKAANDRFQHTVNQMQQTVHGKGFVMEMGGRKREYFSLNELLDDLFTQPEAPKIYRKFYFTTDPLWRDMVTNGPYTTYLTFIAENLDKILGSIESKIHSITMALDMVNGPDHEVTLPVLKALASGERQVTLGDAKHSVAEILHFLRDKRRDWIVQSHEPGEKRDDYTLFSQKTLYYWSTSSLEKMLDGALKATPHYALVASATSKVGPLFDKASQHFTESDLGHTIRQAVENVITEASAAAALVMDLESYLVQHRIYVDHSHAMVGYFARAIEPYLNKFGNGNGVTSVVESLKSIMSELKD